MKAHRWTDPTPVSGRTEKRARRNRHLRVKAHRVLTTEEGLATLFRGRVRITERGA